MQDRYNGVPLAPWPRSAPGLSILEPSITGGSLFMGVSFWPRLCENYFIIFVSGESFHKNYFLLMVYPFNTRLSQKTKQNDSNLPLVFLEFEFSHSLGRKGMKTPHGMNARLLPVTIQRV